MNLTQVCSTYRPLWKVRSIPTTFRLQSRTLELLSIGPGGCESGGSSHCDLFLVFSILKDMDAFGKMGSFVWNFKFN